MALHKLVVDDFDSDDYSLFAIHCDANDYSLAYMINSYLEIQLVRSSYDLDFLNSDATFSIFEWEDEKTFSSWSLIKNSCVVDDLAVGKEEGLLFEENTIISKTTHLINEKPEIDYFLKIEADGVNFNNAKIVKQLNSIPTLSMAYSLSASALKSKAHLIFN
jgi:hypothetical protein